MSGLIVDAVTALLVHEGEVFMMRRHPALLAFPGYDAFPGGKVDAEDAETAPFKHLQLSGFDNRLIQALVRELKEELSFDLEAALEDGSAQSVSLCGRALTPPTFPRRFNTYFFIVRLNSRPTFVLEPREAIDSFWHTTAEWLRSWRAGERIMAPPTLSSLDALHADPDCQRFQVPDIESRNGIALTIGTAERLPVTQSIHGLKHLFVRSNTLPPAEHTNCFVIGDTGSPCVAIDPSPRDETELERLENTLLALGVDQILITHHHQDHRQLADRLARRHRWPMLMSPRTQSLIRARDPAFLEGVDVRLCDDGDVITRWLGHSVRVVAVPGHDEGQLAPMPDNRAWCIVGDLIQGVGTVVISKPEGNMRRYFESLAKIIALKPACIFPSHGVGMGSTYRLEQTLLHRQQREQQVFELHGAGADIAEILRVLYQDIDPRLLPYAQRNIESHLEKLQEEGRLPR